MEDVSEVGNEKKARGDSMQAMTERTSAGRALEGGGGWGRRRVHWKFYDPVGGLFVV